jgi:hypothetical protein
MHFAIINPMTQQTTIVDCVSGRDAYAMAGLSPKHVDHGIVSHDIGIVVYEFGLFTPPSEQSYFAINLRLYAGVAVLYGMNDVGETISLRAVPPISFFQDAKAVERNIALGLVDRPRIAINGVVTWEWPQPRKAMR